MQRTPHDLFRLGGLLAIGAATLPRLSELLLAGPALLVRALSLPMDTGPVSANIFTGTVLLHLAGALGFALAFWHATRHHGGPPAAGMWLVGMQAVLAVLVDPSLLLILAAELPFVLPWRQAAGWLLTQCGVAAAIALLAVDRLQFALSAQVGSSAVELAQPGVPPGGLLAIQVLTGIAWQVFAFGVGHLAMAERRGRALLAATHADLVAAQQRLAQQARVQERLRIARDLHDAMGHHLVALGIHLQLAQHAPSPKAAQALATASTLAQSLLAEMRAAVSSERLSSGVDVEAALQSLANTIPYPRIELHIAPGLADWDAERANILLRCAQEALSNALRHADASRIEVSVSRQYLCEAAGTVVEVTDDGRGAARLLPGNGLKGMQERLQTVSGRLEWTTRPNQGFALRLWLPDPSPHNMEGNSAPAKEVP